MATKKITQLTELTQPNAAAGDVLPIVDISDTAGGTTKKITFASLKSGSFSGSFAGDGSGLTGVTGEWDGSHNGNAQITGSLVLSGSGIGLNVLGNITSSANIKVGGTISNVSTTHVTASGNITGASLSATSTSGTSITSQGHVNVYNNKFLKGQTTTGLPRALIGMSNLDVVQVGNSTSPILLSGCITASNSSTDVAMIAKGSLIVSGSGVTSITLGDPNNPVWQVSNPTGSMSFTGSMNISGSINVGGNPVITGNQTGSYATTGSNNFVGNQTITGSVDITGSLTVSGSGTFTNIGPFSQTGDSNFIGHITASSNISASGYISAFGSSSLIGLPTSKPSITGSLWLSGSAGQGSQYLVVFNGI